MPETAARSNSMLDLGDFVSSPKTATGAQGAVGEESETSSRPRSWKPERPIYMQGTLSKLGRAAAPLVKMWQNRHVVLTDESLMYWQTKEEFLAGRPPKQKMLLKDCSICTAEQHTKKPYAFGIFHPKTRDYFFDALDERNMMDWIHAIERQLGVAQGSVTLSDFELMTLVGKGAYGRVIQVKKKDTGVVYAMKVMNKDDVLKSNQVQRTRTERRVLDVINHPFIVKLHYAFQTEEKLCLVMDFINGGELFTYMINEKRFSEERARFYACELILALQYIHSMDIIYRDLKPENILVDSSGHIRLTDFGLSKDAMESQKTYSMVGSPYYMAPEIILNEGHGKAVDWWSLGILIYEMMCGELPFYNENTRLAYKKLLTCDLEFPDNVEVSDVAKDLLRKMLAHDPKERLGCKEVPDIDPDGVNSIKEHTFFRGVDFDKVLSMEVKPPFAPKVGGAWDTSHFSSNFTNVCVAAAMASKIGEGGLGSRLTSGASAWESFKATHHSEDKSDKESEKHESIIDGVEGRGRSSFRSMDQVGKDNAMLVSDKAYAFLEHGRWDMDVLMQSLVGIIMESDEYGDDDKDRKNFEGAASQNISNIQVLQALQKAVKERIAQEQELRSRVEVMRANRGEGRPLSVSSSQCAEQAGILQDFSYVAPPNREDSEILSSSQ